MQNTQMKVNFEDWLNFLDRVAEWNGYRGCALVKITGAESWLPLYEAGLTPADALDSAENDGKEFGEDYCD